jgi:hypothetical protein
MTMKVLVVGGGGREHAIARALSRSDNTVLFSLMAQRNPGIAALAREVLLERETNVPSAVKFARSRSVDYVVIGPEAYGCGRTPRDGQGLLPGNDVKVRDIGMPEIPGLSPGTGCRRIYPQL